MAIKLILMSLLLHFLADFTLQGCLADMKQRRWWTRTIVKEYDNTFGTVPLVDRLIKLTRHDWLCALLCHSVFWSIATFSPLLWLCASQRTIVIVCLVNVLVHAVIDHLKCNRYLINLTIDQLLHLSQILATYLVVG